MSKKRSPREVCSMTDGMIRFDGGFMWLLTSGGPEFRVGRLLSLFGSPESVARLCQLARDPLHLCGDAVEGIAHANVVSKRLDPAALAELEHRLLGVVSHRFGLLTHQHFDLLIRHVD